MSIKTGLWQKSVNNTDFMNTFIDKVIDCYKKKI